MVRYRDFCSSPSFATFVSRWLKGGVGGSSEFALVRQTPLPGNLPDGAISEVSSTTLRQGDQVKVIGDIIPGDGEVIAGVVSADESAITGAQHQC